MTPAFSKFIALVDKLQMATIRHTTATVSEEDAELLLAFIRLGQVTSGLATVDDPNADQLAAWRWWVNFIAERTS